MGGICNCHSYRLQHTENVTYFQDASAQSHMQRRERTARRGLHQHSDIGLQRGLGTRQNQIATATSQFINDRLAVIEQELGHVDSDISSYKSEHLIPDLALVSQMYPRPEP